MAGYGNPPLGKGRPEGSKNKAPRFLSAAKIIKKNGLVPIQQLIDLLPTMPLILRVATLKWLQRYCEAPPKSLAGPPEGPATVSDLDLARELGLARDRDVVAETAKEA